MKVVIQIAAARFVECGMERVPAIDILRRSRVRSGFPALTFLYAGTSTRRDGVPSRRFSSPPDGRRSCAATDRCATARLARVALVLGPLGDHTWDVPTYRRSRSLSSCRRALSAARLSAGRAELSAPRSRRRGRTRAVPPVPRAYLNGHRGGRLAGSPHRIVTTSRSHVSPFPDRRRLAAALWLSST